VCERAHRLLQGCGATLPVLEGEACTGFNRLVSRCIAEQARDCDGLATLVTRLEDCASDGGEALLPEDDPQLPLPNDFIRDGGTHDAGF
jgi:hypothetical protein